MQHAFTAANEGSFTRQPLGALLKTYAEVGNAEQYPMVNKQLDPENDQFLVETNLPTPICQGLC